MRSGLALLLGFALALSGCEKVQGLISPAKAAGSAAPGEAHKEEAPGAGEKKEATAEKDKKDEEPDEFALPFAWESSATEPLGRTRVGRLGRIAGADDAIGELDGQSFVTPDHIRAVMHDCLRHRLILTYEALSEGLNADAVIAKIMARIPAPAKPLEHEKIAA